MKDSERLYKVSTNKYGVRYFNAINDDEFMEKKNNRMENVKPKICKKTN